MAMDALQAKYNVGKDSDVADRIVVVNGESESVVGIDAYIKGMKLNVAYTVEGDGKLFGSDGVRVKNTKGEVVFALNLDDEMSIEDKFAALETLATNIDGDLIKQFGEHYATESFNYRKGSSLTAKPGEQSTGIKPNPPR